MNGSQDGVISPIFFQRYLEDQKLNKSMFIFLQKIEARILNWACYQQWLRRDPFHTECSKISSMYKFMEKLNVKHMKDMN